MKPFKFDDLACNDSNLAKKVLDCLDRLEDCAGEYGCDLQHRLFNEEQEYIYYAEAESDLNELGTFTCIKVVFNYEKFNFGEFGLNEIDACRFANMLVYITGEMLLNKSQHLTETCWDREVDVRDIEIIRNELQAYLETLNSDLTNITFDEWENV